MYFPAARLSVCQTVSIYKFALEQRIISYLYKCKTKNNFHLHGNESAQFKTATSLPPFQSVIMKTTRVHSPTDIVTDNHVITDFKHCSLYWTLGGSCFCMLQLRGKIRKEIQCNFIAFETLRDIKIGKGVP
jgi:hypothetical protein